MKRSGFLLGTISGLTVAAKADSFFAGALAQPLLPGLPGGVDERVLVIVNLQGGNDGLNTIVPHGMQPYYRYRPTLGIPANDVLQINDKVGFNPEMRSLKGMYDAGNVAIVQGAGYPQPDHSHFRSTEIWQTAAPDRFESTGWIGRFLDSADLPSANLFNAVAVAPVLPEVMISRKTDVPAIAALQGYGLASDRRADTRTAFAEMRPPWDPSAIRQAGRIRRRRSDAAFRWPPKSSGAVSARASFTYSTARSTRMPGRSRRKTACCANSPTASKPFTMIWPRTATTSGR